MGSQPSMDTLSTTSESLQVTCYNHKEPTQGSAPVSSLRDILQISSCQLQPAFTTLAAHRVHSVLSLYTLLSSPQPTTNKKQGRKPFAPFLSFFIFFFLLRKKGFLPGFLNPIE